MFRWPSSDPDRTVSTGSDISDDRVSLLVAQQLEEYKYNQLKKKEAKLMAKLSKVREQLAEMYPEYRKSGRNTLPSSPCSSLQRRLYMTSSDNNLDTSLLENSLVPTPSLSHISLSSDRLEQLMFSAGQDSEINDQDASMREKNVIDFETMSQMEEESLTEWMTRLQHGVVGAYGDEERETLQRRVAWGFIRGCRDPNVRCWVVANGWNRNGTETLTPSELLALAISVIVKCE